MKKKSIVIILTILLFPVIVHADPGGPLVYDLDYEAYVNAKNGIKILSDECIGSFYEYAEEEYGEYDENDCQTDIVIPYKAIVTVKYLEISPWDDEDNVYHIIEYKGQKYYVEPEYLTGTKVDFDTYQEYITNNMFHATGDIKLLNGPDEIFDYSEYSLKAGDVVTVTYALPTGYYYVTSDKVSGWISDDDIFKDGFNGYFEEKGVAHLIKKDEYLAYNSEGDNLTPSSNITDYYTINYVGYVAETLLDYWDSIGEEYYVYLDENNNYIYINLDCLTNIYDVNDDEDDYGGNNIYISNNADVNIIDFANPSNKVDSTKVLKNHEFYTVLEDYIDENYVNYFYIIENKHPYIIILEYDIPPEPDDEDEYYYIDNYSKTYEFSQYENLKNHFGAAYYGLDMERLLDKDVNYYAKPSTKSTKKGTIKKGEFIYIFGSYYDDIKDDFYINVLNYGWVKVELNMFKMLTEEEFYIRNQLDVGYYSNEDEKVAEEEKVIEECRLFAKGELKIEEDSWRDEDYYNKYCYLPEADTETTYLEFDAEYDERPLVLNSIEDKKLIKLLYPLFDDTYYEWDSENNEEWEDIKERIKASKDRIRDAQIGGVVESSEVPISGILKSFELMKIKPTNPTNNNNNNERKDEAIGYIAKPEPIKFKVPLIIAICAAGAAGCIITLLIVGNNRKKRLQTEQPIESNIQQEEPIIDPVPIVEPKEEDKPNIIDTKKDIYEKPVESTVEEENKNE